MSFRQKEMLFTLSKEKFHAETQRTQRKRITSFFSIVFLCSAFAFSQDKIQFKTIATGFDQATSIVDAGDGRMFVLERKGKIKIVNSTGSVETRPFLNILSYLQYFGGEQGLLGMALSPDYTHDRTFYIFYTDTSPVGYPVVSRYKVSENDADSADALSQERLLRWQHLFRNHNGGHLCFGADGYLYIGSGDGGSTGDPSGHGQKINTLLGKILRVDVNTDSSYFIPPDNPFANASDTTVKKEIWHYGLRNPWKYSFDRITNEMWIGDVGQDAWEEIDKQPEGIGGLNFGWRCREGSHNFIPADCDSSDNLINPVYEYAHDTTAFCTSVTGGYVYRGALVKKLFGKYIWAELCENNLLSLEIDSPYTASLLKDSVNTVTTFGEDKYGELYLTPYSSSGDLLKIVDTVDCSPVAVVFPQQTINLCNQPAELFTPYNPALTYQWYRNTVTIPNQVNSTLQTSIPGIYSVKVNKGEGCETLSEEFIVDECLNPDEINILVYPSPGSGMIKVFFSKFYSAEIEMHIFDVSGRKIADSNLIVSKENTTTLNVSGLSNGIYFFDFVTRSGTFTKKFIKTGLK